MTRLSFLLPHLFFVITALVVGLVFRYPLVTDDPYITYRYAQNVVDGTGFVFNAGERVLSTTTPLYALTLAALGFFYREIPTIGYWLSVLSFGVAAGLLYASARAEKMQSGGIIAGLLLLFSPALMATFGLETGFYLMLGIAALYAYSRARVSLAFAFAALLTLTRNDGILLVAILTAHYLWTNRNEIGNSKFEIRSWQLLRPFFVYLLILAPWLIFAWAYFGAPFPFTLAAKIAQAQSGLWKPFLIGFVQWLGENVVWLAPQFVFAILGIVWAVQKRSLLLLFGAWAIAHLAAYSLLGVAFYPWYVAPLFPALCLFAGIGVEFGARRLAARMRVKTVLQIALIIFFAAIMLVSELRASVDAGMLQPSPKVEAYTRAAEWLAHNAEANASVDALEVGVIGYFDQRRTYDFVGLVDPMRIPYLRAQKFADGVRRRAAEYVIAIPPDVWLPDDVWFKDAYRAARRIRVENFYSNRPLVIYQRADAGRAPIESRSVNAAFEKWIELQNVELFAHEITRGEIFPLRLKLRALNLGAVPESWKFTIQLVGAQDRVIAQTDNYYPARLPEDGKPFADYQGIPIPQDAPPGTYELILAMYDVQKDERLSLYDANGNEVGDFVSLGQITVK